LNPFSALWPPKLNGLRGWHVNLLLSACGPINVNMHRFLQALKKPLRAFLIGWVSVDD